MSQITKDIPDPALLIISLEVFQTGVILLHAHPQGVHGNCVKFHQY